MASSAWAATLLLLSALAACGEEVATEPDQGRPIEEPYCGEPTGQGGVRSVLVVGPAAADQRVQATREAVQYWNQVFAELGVGQPFGTVDFLEQEIPEYLLAAYSRSVLEGTARPTTPNAFTEIAADVVIALSDSEIISFATRLDDSGQWLVGIRTDRSPPLSLPNVPRNLVAHELGHVLGLGHNSDPTKLMCGRPATCRPGDFQSSEPRFFELTGSERAELVELHC